MNAPQRAAVTLRCRPVTAALLTLLALGSYWAMPMKLRFGEGGSYYTFAAVCDEMIYANRMQPLPDGCTVQNPLNGICDPDVLSPYFLEDVVREFTTVSGMSIIALFWLWRVAFPVIFFTSLYLLARAVMPKRYWSSSVLLVLTSTLFAAHFVIHMIAVPYPQMTGFLFRIPSNIEYPIAAVLAGCMYRFSILRTTAWGLFSALLMAVLIYLRPYAAFPWVIVAAGALGLMTINRQMKLRTALTVVGILGLLLLPLVAVFHHNGALLSYQQTLQRYFMPRDYQIHPNWLVFLIIGGLLFFAARRVPRRLRILIGCAAGIMLTLPVTAGAWSVTRHELLFLDRFSSFYIPLLSLAFLVILRNYRAALLSPSSRAPTLAKAATAVVLAGFGVRHTFHDYNTDLAGCYTFVRTDQISVPAYEWLREHSETGALVLTDERIHYGALEWKQWYEGMRMAWSEDLFQVITRRRPVYHWRMYGSFMTNEQYAQLVWLQRVTFGLEPGDPVVTDRAYAKLLAWYRPGYILWRAGRPGMRGRGERLRKIATVEYKDVACEIWKLNYPEGVLGHPENVAPGDLLNP